MRRFIAFLLTFLIIAALPLTALASEAVPGQDPYDDMPKSDWGREAVLKAREYGLMNGVSDKSFGTGRNMSRQQFVTVLVRMMGWELTDSGDKFSDISSAGSRREINTAADRGVLDPGGNFRPTEPITRREMAVMLVRALGLKHLAEDSLPLPFTDVREDRGYIAVAYDIRMTNGTSETTFSPEGNAKREQAAAMLVRVYERYISGTTWTHGFYAISSHSQIELAKRLDAVTLGWSRMTYTGGGAALNTTSEGGNEYRIPDGWEDVVKELGDAGVKLHLGVFMTDSGSALSGLLADSAAAEDAIGQIVNEAKTLKLSGVTVDFEGLYKPSKDSFTAFVTALDHALESEGLTLYVTVMPATADGIYYDGYDYRALGEAADRVILMAHDYAPLRMEESLLHSDYYKNSALTPIASVYYSLRVLCDPATGMDPGKAAVNLSMDADAWETDENGLLISREPIHPAVSTIAQRLRSGARMGWSETLKNPYLTYDTESGQHIFLWYEDERSVEVKLSLARMLGVTGLSVWRLGIIPDSPEEGIYYDVASAILAKN